MRRLSMVIGLGLGLGLGGCKGGETLVVVAVSAEPALSSVQKLHVHAATEDGTAMDYDFAPGAPFSLPPAKTFALQVAARYSGTFTVAVTASDGTSDLASKSGSATLSPGDRVDLPITLGAGAPGDGGTDGGPPDMAPAVRPSFAAPANVPGAPNFRNAIVADLNNDMRPDVVGPANVAPGTSMVVSLISNGDGTLMPGPTIMGHAATADSYADNIAAMDLDHEGSTDVIIANGQEITVVYGPGFTNSANYASMATGVGCAVGRVRLADFTGDGNPDVVSVNNCQKGIEYWSGTGDGRFNNVVGQMFTAAGVQQDVVVGDLNLDGKLDFVTSDASQLDVVLGAGGGTIGASVPIPTPSQINTGLHLADVDADGKLDILYIEANTVNIAVLRGNGDGTFRGAVELKAPSQNPGAIAIADFDGDSKLDIAGTAPNGGNVIFVARGNGDGTFAAPVSYDSGQQPFGELLALDLNGDGKPDLVSTQPFVVLLNDTP